MKANMKHAVQQYFLSFFVLDALVTVISFQFWSTEYNEMNKLFVTFIDDFIQTISK